MRTRAENCSRPETKAAVMAERWREEEGRGASQLVKRGYGVKSEDDGDDEKCLHTLAAHSLSAHPPPLTTQPSPTTQRRRLRQFWKLRESASVLQWVWPQSRAVRSMQRSGS